MKKVLIIGLVLMTSMCIGCGKKETKTEEENQVQIQEIKGENINEEQIVDGIRFKGASLVVKNNTSEFRVTLENTVTTVKKIDHLTIIFKDENGAVIKEFNHYDFESLRKGETKNLSFTFSLDLSNVKKVEYKLQF